MGKRANYDTNGQFDNLPAIIGINFDLKNGATFGGDLGVYSRAFGGSRFELEGSRTGNEVGYLTYAEAPLPSNFKMETRTFMLNLLKKIPFCSEVSGYIGGGVG